MTRKLIKTIMLIGIVTSLLGCEKQSPSNNVAVGSSGEAIVLGDISFEPEKKKKRFQPIADYLAANLSDFGIGKGEVKIVTDKDKMAELMKSGEIDIYMDSIYPAMFMVEEIGAKPILRRWKNGISEYHSVLIVPSNSKLKSLSDLQGKMIALESPFSTSAYMMPVVYMLKAGLNPVQKEEANHPVGVDEVGYVFGGKDDEILKWVIEGKVVAGFIGSEDLDDLPEEIGKKLKVLEETEKFPRQVVVAAPDMNPAQLKAIENVLLNMHKTEEGKELLVKFKKTSQFDRFPGGAQAAISNMKESYKLVQENEKKQLE